MDTMLPTVHAPTQHSLASTLALVTSVLQEHSVFKVPLYLRRVQQGHTMMSLVSINASLVHLVSTVWDGQSLSSTTLVQVVITAKSTLLNHMSTHARQAHLIT